MTATQTPDGMIYLSDGKIVYNFNLAWLMEGAETSSAVKKNESALFMYPNPGKGHFLLEFNDAYTGKIELRICACDGRTLYHRKMIKEQYAYREPVELDLAPGAYLVLLDSGSEKHTSWLIAR